MIRREEEAGSPPKEYWFPAKRYGYGWGIPVRWQGWATLAVFLAVVIGSGAQFMPGRPVAFLLTVTAASALLVIVCYLKGEPARWRWGDGDTSGR